MAQSPYLATVSTSQITRSGSTSGCGTGGSGAQLLARFAGGCGIGTIDTAFEHPDNTRINSARHRNSRSRFINLTYFPCRSSDHHIGLIAFGFIRRRNSIELLLQKSLPECLYKPAKKIFNPVLFEKTNAALYQSTGFCHHNFIPKFKKNLLPSAPSPAGILSPKQNPMYRSRIRSFLTFF